MAASPGDWSLRYLNGNTPWDMRRAHPELARRLERDPTLGMGRTGSALVPGCGRGHDALALAEAGWAVAAVDFASVLESGARGRLEAAGARMLVTDALSLDDETFDLVFDHTFFCAIDPSERMRFGGMVGRLTAWSGSLVSLVFPVGRSSSDGGPPHGMAVSDVSLVLADDFRLVEESSPFRTGRRSWPHVWARWQRGAPDSALRLNTAETTS